MTASLELWPIGNCQVSALIDRAGRYVWGCIPRVDGDPAFSSLLDDAPRAGEGAFGFWEIDLKGTVQQIADASDQLASAAEELTANLRLLDPADPVKYDFALFGAGVDK